MTRSKRCIARVFAACGVVLSLGWPCAGAMAGVALPGWVGLQLDAGETVARIDTCGHADFLVTTSIEAGFSGGRAFRARAFGDAISIQEVGRWLHDDLAAPGDVVRVAGAIALADAGSALEAVRGFVPPGGHVEQVLIPKRERRVMGELVEWHRPDAIDVAVREAAGGNRRLFRVVRSSTGTEVSDLGIRGF